MTTLSSSFAKLLRLPPPPHPPPCPLPPLYRQVELPYGSQPYILLGGTVITVQLLLQARGPPAIQNSQVIIGLAVGYFAAGVSVSYA